MTGTDPATVRLLLVEDNAADARILRELLGEVEPRVHLAHVGRLREALRNLGQGSYDALLLDLGLPDARGTEAVAAINYVAPALPIVVLSGMQDEALAIQAVQHGAQDYLVKGQAGSTEILRAVRYAIERKRSEQYFTHLAHHDALTKLPNRRLFLDRLRQALARTRRDRKMLAVLFLDLDRFKELNDTHGHAAGDQLLKGTAERLRACTRESDTVGRLGGDEFVLILPEITRLEDVRTFADKIFQALAAPFPLPGGDLTISASMGISLYPNDSDTPEALLRNADAAMYRAKQRGGNTHQFCFPAMNISASERLRVAGALRHALEQDQFVLHYQPLVDLSDGRVIGMEALTRWRHPDLGLVPPAQFIPIAEETGLIVPIGEWVLLRGCGQVRSWQADGFPGMRLAVNCSPRQFQQGTLKSSVERALHDSGLDPSCLEIELAEPGITRHAESARQAMRDLSDLGVRLSIDDFGTGDSSVNHLRRFPIQALKIDQSFIHDIPGDLDDAAVVSAIIAMAHHLRIEVVAEGVESAGQVAFLRQQHCDQSQGFYFAHPLPAEAIGELLRQGPPWRHA